VSTGETSGKSSIRFGTTAATNRSDQHAPAGNLGATHAQTSQPRERTKVESGRRKDGIAASTTTRTSGFSIRDLARGDLPKKPAKNNSKSRREQVNPDVAANISHN
jgi:hypothetical protein